MPIKKYPRRKKSKSQIKNMKKNVFEKILPYGKINILYNRCTCIVPISGGHCVYMMCFGIISDLAPKMRRKSMKINENQWKSMKINVHFGSQITNYGKAHHIDAITPWYRYYACASIIYVYLAIRKDFFKNFFFHTFFFCDFDFFSPSKTWLGHFLIGIP